MGRPPKPIEQKRLLGNPGKRKLVEPAITLPAVPVATPDPPRGLRRHGKEVWIRLWSAGAAWLSPDTDRDILIRLCQLHDERAQLLKVARVGQMLDTLEELAQVIDEREDADAGEVGAEAVGGLLQVIIKRIRRLEERAGPEEGSSRESAAPRKRKRGRAPLTGYFSLGSTGQLVLHPAVKALRLVDAEIRRLESLCGFNPSDRSRLGLARVKAKSKLEELLERRQKRQAHDSDEEAEE